MNADLKVEDLEKALMQRANDLADEYLQRAKRSHDHYIEDENERLQLHEEKEIMSAKMLADCTYRSQVQSSELRVQKKLDQLRWQLIKNVLTQAKENITHIITNKEQYQQLLIEFIKHSISSINSKTLVVELNHSDYQNLHPQWHMLIKQIKCKNTIELSNQFHHMSGGVIVYNDKRTIRIDNTFEGRIERLSETIHQLVAEEFFSELSHESDKIHGR
jgi:V/A-type H+-transporting ATPase subunit E